jgi:isoleucyl-tRNA synthetase
MGGAACKIIIDGGNNNGMGEQLIGAVRQLQVVNDNVSKMIAELEEYLTPEEKKAVVELSYEVCEFGEKQLLDYAHNIVKFADKVSDFYIDLAKKYAYAHDE